MILKKYRTLLFCLTGVFLVSPTLVYAGGDSGFYLGAGIGDAKVKAKSLNASDSAGKILGGYNFGVIPFIDIAVEAAYINFGNKSYKEGGLENSYKLSGSNAYGLVGLSFGVFGVFAKAGAINWSSDIVINNVKTSNSGTDTAYGIGARVQIDTWSVRAEYEVFDVSSVDELTMLSLNIIATF